MHLLTLAVDCGGACTGGELRFRTGHFRPGLTFEAEPGAFRWASAAGGDWCCWFATQEHCVTPVHSGTRAVATFTVRGRGAAGFPGTSGSSV